MTEIIVHPLVVLNVSDHYVRLKVNISDSGKKGECVFGGIMGVLSKERVEMLSCFELPLENGVIDTGFVKTRVEQCKKICPTHELLGLYTTAPMSDPVKTQIMQIVQGSQLLLLVLNPEDAKSKVFPVSVYSVNKSGVLEKQALKIVSDEPERIGIEHISHHSDTSKSSQFMTHLTGLSGSLEILYQKVLEVCKRAEQMEAGEIPYNCDFARKAYFLSKMLPAPNSPSFRQKLSDEYDDAKMIVYMSTITMIADTLNELVKYK